MAPSSKTIIFEWSYPLAPVTREKLLHLCRAASYTLLLSNDIRRNVSVLCLYSDGYTVTIDGSRVRMLRMDEESCTGLMRKAVLRGRVPGVRVSRGAAPQGQPCSRLELPIRACTRCLRVKAPVVNLRGVPVYAWFAAAVALMEADTACLAREAV